ncbi:MAG: response regulator [Ktedonobacterales bacterium]|jgi:adenylate cyclase
MAPPDSPDASTTALEAHTPPLVLIVDDEAPIAEALAMIVEEAGYPTLTAFRGPVGLELARAHHPALIFTDMMMPKLDGAGLIAAVRRDAEASHTPAPIIIAMTAGGLQSIQRADADGILPKPFTIEDVEVILRRWLPRAEEDGEA